MAEKREDGFIARWLREAGYTPDLRMAPHVSRYWGWYVADNKWYHYKRRKGFRTYAVERDTLRPASLVCSAWSDLLMNEKLAISSPDPAMARVIDGHFGGFAIDSADFVARAFALGTGAWAIDADGVSDDGLLHPGARVGVSEYDATQIVPLTYSAGDCAQCAFVSRVEHGGRDYVQCQAHVLRGGTYHIVTQLFDPKDHRPVGAEGVVPDLDTRSEAKTFALVRPAVPNVHFDYCAMGASVFDDAIGPIKCVDEAVTSMLRALRVCQPKVFVDETLIEVKTTRDGKGKPVREYAAFGEMDDVVFRMKPGDEGSEMMRVVQPDMRVAEHAEAVNTALKLLSMRCGLGKGYWSWDLHGGLKTATEVVSESSDLARSLKRHQNAARKAVVGIVRGVAGVLRGLCGEAVDPGAEVSVDFDDSVITDTQTDKSMALAEISALQVPALKRRYLARWCGFSEAEAAEAVPDEASPDGGW